MQYKLSFPNLPDFSCHALTLKGQEGLSQIFEYTIEAISENLCFQGLSGQRAQLSITDSMGVVQKQLTGVIQSASYPVDFDESVKPWPYQFTLISPFYYLQQDVNSRVFVDKTVEEILESVISAYPQFHLDIQSETLKNARYEMLVQEKETDYDFLHRLIAANQGVYDCYFDDYLFLMRIHKAEPYQYVPKQFDITPVYAQASEAGMFEVISKQNLLANAYHSLTYIKAKTKEVQYQLGQCIQLKSLIDGFQPDWHNKPYRVVDIHLKGAVSRRGLTQDQGWIEDFVCDLVLVPLDVAYQPTVPWNPKPAMGYYQASIDKHPNGKVLDDHGLYRIKFSFDTMNETGQTSKPIPLLQPVAHTKQGMHFPLAFGTQVVIAYEQGDRNNPVIIGVLPTLNDPTPHDDKSPWKHHIKTYSGSSITFDDNPKAPSIKLATKDDDCRFILEGKEEEPKIEVVSETGDIHVEVAEDCYQEADAMQQDTDYLAETVQEENRQMVSVEDDISVSAKESMTCESEQALQIQSNEAIMINADTEMSVHSENKASFVAHHSIKIDGSYVEIQASGDVNLTANQASLSVGSSQISSDSSGQLSLKSTTIVLKAPQVLTP